MSPRLTDSLISQSSSLPEPDSISPPASVKHLHPTPLYPDDSFPSLLSGFSLSAITPERLVGHSDWIGRTSQSVTNLPRSGSYHVSDLEATPVRAGEAVIADGVQAHSSDSSDLTVPLVSARAPSATIRLEASCFDLILPPCAHVDRTLWPPHYNPPHWIGSARCRSDAQVHRQRKGGVERLAVDE
jgi:hypothetical protein